MSARVIESVSLQQRILPRANMGNEGVVPSVSLQMKILPQATQEVNAVSSTSLSLAGYDAAGTLLPKPAPLPPLASVARRKRTWRE